MGKVLAVIIFFFPYILVAQSYKKLHNKSVVADTHNDVLSTVIMKGLSIEKDLSGKAHSDLARFKKGGVDIQVFSVFCDERFGKDTAFKYANIEIDSLYAIVSRNLDKLTLVTSPTELQQSIKDKKIAAMIGVEGGHMIEDRLDYLDSLFKRGARYMTLTWNNSTSWATSAKDETSRPASERSSVPAIPARDESWQAHKGLTSFGQQIVKRMNNLGMMIDVSHNGEQTFWDVINTTSKPVIASHSSVHALCPHSRNLKDDQIKAIGKNGGVIFINFYSGFIDSTYIPRKENFLNRHKPEADSLKALKLPNYEIDEWISKKYPEEAESLRPPLSMLIDHIDYIVKLIGADHVGLGSDFDGIESAPKELDSVMDFPKITQALLKRGYSKKDIKKILGENFIRVFYANQ